MELKKKETIVEMALKITITIESFNKNCFIANQAGKASEKKISFWINEFDILCLFRILKHI